MSEKSTSMPGSAPTRQPAPRVLLAEDNPISRRLVIDYLTHKGFSVTGAADGEDALAQLRSTPPDVLILDIQMPRLDGFAVLNAIRADTDPRVRAIPVIALTGMAMQGDEAMCMAAGANAYCSKPVRLDKLSGLVQWLFDKAT